MEFLLLLFLLSTAGDSSVKSSLASLLSFYRENRALLLSLAGDAKNFSAASAAPAAAASTVSAPSEPPAQSESRPQEVGTKTILEEYLRRASL